MPPKLRLPQRPKDVLSAQRLAGVVEKLQPLNDFVLIEELPYESYDKYKGYEHIIVPTRYEHGPEDRPIRGIVIAKGLSCKEEAVGLGHKVVIGKWDGARIHRNNRVFILVKEDNVMAVWE